MLDGFAVQQNPFRAGDIRCAAHPTLFSSLENNNNGKQDS